MCRFNCDSEHEHDYENTGKDTGVQHVLNP